MVLLLIYLVAYESDMPQSLPVKYIKASSRRTQGYVLFGSCHTSVLKEKDKQIKMQLLIL